MINFDNAPATEYKPTPYEDAYGLQLSYYPDFWYYHPMIDTWDGCDKCKGAGGFMGSELQGDGPWTTSVNTWADCPECLGSERCPGCLQPLWLSFDQSALPDFEFEIKHYDGKISIGCVDLFQDAIANICNYPFICLCCGWSYDPDRLADQYDEPDYYPDDDPGFDPMFLM